jgi:hypothetical protein
MSLAIAYYLSSILEHITLQIPWYRILGTMKKDVSRKINLEDHDINNGKW